MGKNTSSSKRPWGVLITGGCGFIGLNLIHFMTKSGYSRVRILDDLSTSKKENLESLFSEMGDYHKTTKEGKICYYLDIDTQFINIHPSDMRTSTPGSLRCELIIGDIRDKSTCIIATQNMDAVVHLAGQTGVIPSLEDPFFDCDNNIIGTLNVLHASVINGVEKFVFASSCAPLGEQDPPVHEMKIPKPLSPYGVSKLAAEAYCYAYYESFGLKTISFRFSNVYGPRSKHKGSVVAVFFTRAIEGLPLVIYGTGEQTRDFLYVDDLCDIILKSLIESVAGEVFHIATSKEISVNTIAQYVKKIVERDTGNTVKIIYKGARKGEISRSVSDISKARSILGYEPRVHVSQGMELTWSWWRNRPGT